MLLGTLLYGQLSSSKGQQLVRIHIIDSLSRQPLTGVTIQDQHAKAVMTDATGRAEWKTSHQKLQLTASILGYAPTRITVLLDTLYTPLYIYMRTTSEVLQEVVVTGRETKGMTSSTLINREAMKVLQPSSFADLMELLPGKRFVPPILTASNPMSIRETGISDPDFDASVFGGVSFLVDGRPLATQSNMQRTGMADMQISVESGYTDGSRHTVGLGVDMRSISTDHIQEVEIIRGIPSVQYGNLTSGLVKIKRKAGESPLSLRFKADGLSKLFYGGKGVQLADQTFLNVGIDFLNAKGQPTYPLENFNRLTGMIKLDHRWQNTKGEYWQWNAAVDIASTLDKEKKDADVGNVEINSYRSHNRGMTLSNSISMEHKDRSWFRSLELIQSADIQKNTIEQTKWIQLSSPVVIPNSIDEGEHDGIYLPGQYISELEVHGRPIMLYSKLVSAHVFDQSSVKQHWSLGAEWSYDKNYGKGQIFDTQLPPFYGEKIRPRSFNSIPANQEIAVFVEDHLRWQIARHGFQVLAGLRANKMLIDRHFKNLNQWTWDPRVNFSWALPSIDLFGNPLKATLNAGWGRASRKPVMSQISPDPLYWDFIQLNFFHENPAYRRVNLMTFRQDPTNPNIKPASNTKKEVRLSVDYAESHWSVTLFDEVMDNGFRDMAHYASFAFKRYNTQGIDLDNITAPPDISKLAYEVEKQLRPYSVPDNGSRIHKRGIEFQVYSPRFSFLNTRLTADGAWYRTMYTNSLPVYKEPQNPIVIDGRRMQYFGLFHMDEGNISELFTSKFSIDNYLPNIGLTLFSSFQFRWFSSTQSAWNDGMPISYIDVEGVVRPYTEASLSDPHLRQLRILYGDNAFDVQRRPLSMMANIKATKNIGKKIRLAMYVNSLFEYTKSSNRQGDEFRSRGLNTPYFGMEINFEI